MKENSLDVVRTRNKDYLRWGGDDMESQVGTITEGWMAFKESQTIEPMEIYVEEATESVVKALDKLNLNSSEEDLEDIETDFQDAARYFSFLTTVTAVDQFLQLTKEWEVTILNPGTNEKEIKRRFNRLKANRGMIYMWFANNVYRQRKEESTDLESIISATHLSHAMSVDGSINSPATGFIKAKDAVAEKRLKNSALTLRETDKKKETPRRAYDDPQALLVVLRVCMDKEGARSLETEVPATVMKRAWKPFYMNIFTQASMDSEEDSLMGMVPKDFGMSLLRVLEARREEDKSKVSSFNLDNALDGELTIGSSNRMGLWTAMDRWASIATLALMMGKKVRMGQLITFLNRNLHEELLKSMEGIFALSEGKISVDGEIEDYSAGDDLDDMTVQTGLGESFPLYDKLLRTLDGVKDQTLVVKTAWIDYYTNGGQMTDDTKRMVKNMATSDEPASNSRALTDSGGGGIVGGVQGYGKFEVLMDGVEPHSGGQGEFELPEESHPGEQGGLELPEEDQMTKCGA